MILDRYDLKRTWTSGACAQAPIDIAVAAITSEIASASVANNPTPARRLLAKVLSDTEDAKPTFPVSSIMVVVLVASFGESA